MTPPNDPMFVAVTDDGAVVRFRTSIYGIDTVARAAHRLTDRCFIHLDHEDDEHVVCRLMKKRAGDDIAALAGELANEALDQMLRARIAAETEQTRLLLLAHAFSNTNLVHPELDEEDPTDDPARIGVDDASRLRSEQA